VTGGSGFLGINLVRHLLARGERVRTLDIAPFDYPEKAHIETCLGDVRDRQAVDAAMSGVTIAVHCAAALPLYRRHDIYTTEVEGTRRVLEAAVAHKVARVIHISSTAVYGIPDHHPIDEHDPLRGVGPYGEAKIEAERQCLEFRAAGLCVPILRPKTFVGPERLGVFELLYEWAYEGRSFPIIGPGTNRYQLLDVEDLCKAIVLGATLDERVVDDVFNIGAKEFGTFKEDVQAVLDEAGHGRRIVPIPAAPAIAILRAAAALRLSPIYRWVYETAGTDSIVSIARSEQKLGFAPAYSNRDALLRNYRWYVTQRGRFDGVRGVSHRAPWKRGVLALAKAFF
jgi:nucleoside-diphosphate-sugar epimerase